MTPSFTVRQGEYLAFMHRFTLRHGIAPSFDEIAAHFGTSPPSGNGMIKTLERQGLLSRLPGAARSLRVLVPASLLPESDYGSRARRRPSAGLEVGALSLEDVAVTAAAAVLDVLMPKLVPTLPPGAETSGPVTEAAVAVHKSLAKAGLSPKEAEQIARRVGAEAARWRPGGRGIVGRRRGWAPR
jgi:hypothetical protein